MLPSDRKPIGFAEGGIPRRRKRRRSSPWYSRYSWLLLLLLLVLAGISYPWVSTWWSSPHTPRYQPLPGYITDAGLLRQEYLRFQGKPLGDTDVEHEFDSASDSMNRGEFSSSAALLENVARIAPVPVVFNNLGVLAVKLGDGARAVGAFREVLSRDSQYAITRQNLTRFKLGASADPMSREAEPNGNDQNANTISLGQPIEAEISLDVNDIDCFRVVSPPSPRDLLLVSLANHSATLAPRIRLYDVDDRPLDWSKESDQEGTSISETISPPPNAVLYVHVEGLLGSAGAYSLTVSALKAFDAFEPNDDILDATRIGLDQAVEANIMDAQDTDYYSFRGSERGSVTVEIKNRSKNLVPALTTFSPEMTNSGSAPKLTVPGSDLHYTMKVENGKSYFLQVWGEAKTAGDYTLTIH
jgi:hypothetical protein